MNTGIKRYQAVKKAAGAVADGKPGAKAKLKAATTAYVKHVEKTAKDEAAAKIEAAKKKAAAVAKVSGVKKKSTATKTKKRTTAGRKKTATTRKRTRR